MGLIYNPILYLYISQLYIPVCIYHSYISLFVYITIIYPCLYISQIYIYICLSVYITVIYPYFFVYMSQLYILVCLYISVIYPCMRGIVSAWAVCLTCIICQCLFLFCISGCWILYALYYTRKLNCKTYWRKFYREVGRRNLRSENSQLLLWICTISLHCSGGLSVRGQHLTDSQPCMFMTKPIIKIENCLGLSLGNYSKSISSLLLRLTVF